MTRLGAAHGFERDQQAGSPYRLLWFVGIIALTLSGAAFVLWGFNGAGVLVDIVAVVCG